MPDGTRVEVRGLRELAGAFRQVDRELPKGLQRGLKKVAEHVVDVIRPQIPHESGEAAASVRPRATQRGAGIAFPAGGKSWQGTKAGYYPWLDFGGGVGRKHSVKRDVIKGGRYLYPAIDESRGYIIEAVDEVIEDVAKDAGFKTTGHG